MSEELDAGTEPEPSPADAVAPAEPEHSAEPDHPAGPDHSAEPQEPAGPTRLRIRRAPRYRAFGLTGAGLGVALGVILALSLEVSNAASVTSAGVDYSTRSVAGYFLAIFGLLGLAIGLGLAVLIERRRS